MFHRLLIAAGLATPALFVGCGSPSTSSAVSQSGRSAPTERQRPTTQPTATTGQTNTPDRNTGNKNDSLSPVGRTNDPDKSTGGKNESLPPVNPGSGAGTAFRVEKKDVEVKAGQEVKVNLLDIPTGQTPTVQIDPPDAKITAVVENKAVVIKAGDQAKGNATVTVKAGDKSDQVKVTIGGGAAPADKGK